MGALDGILPAPCEALAGSLSEWLHPRDEQAGIEDLDLDPRRGRAHLRGWAPALASRPSSPCVDPVLRKRILYAYGTSQRALMDGPLDARALAAECGLELRRARACLRGSGSPWAPHMEARRIVECGDRVLALGAHGYTWTQIGRRFGMGVYTLSHWASGCRSPSWLGGELLLHAWRSAATPGEWPPAALPASAAPDPGAVPAPV